MSDQAGLTAKSVAALGEPVEPFSAEHLAASWTRPLGVFDLVLSSPDRVAANVDRRQLLVALSIVFLLASAVFSVPYGLVLGTESWWRVMVLYLGSTLICLPSLYVFASYLGVRITFPQVLVLALTIPSVAALFSFGFAPILGFLRATMDTEAVEQHREISWRTISVVLLWLAGMAGIGQLWRCLLAAPGLARKRALLVVLLVWHGVFLHVVLRMASVLGLDG